MTTAKLGRREQRQLMQRQEILAAAAELFSEKGIHKVSMHEIARRAEYGIGTLYKFFANKDELFSSLMFENVLELHNAVMGVLEQDKHPIEVIHEYVAVMWNHQRKDIKLIRLFFPEMEGPGFDPRGQGNKDIRVLFDRFMKKLASVFERGIEEKIFRPFDPDFMAVALEALVRAFLRQAMRDPSLLESQDSQALVMEMLFKGLLTPPAGDEAT